MLFEFSQPLRSFGAWFGDIETRPGTTTHPETPAYYKLIGENGTVVAEGVVPTATANLGDPVCGGPDLDSDIVACANQAMRWLGGEDAG